MLEVDFLNLNALFMFKLRSIQGIQEVDFPN